MRIIKHGKCPDAMGLFICKNCGCNFEACARECKTRYINIEETKHEFYCVCPDCGNIVKLASDKYKDVK